MDLYKFYTNILWVSAYVYGIFKPVLKDVGAITTKATKTIYTYIYNFFTITKNGDYNNIMTDNLNVYMSDGEEMIPFSFNISKLHTIKRQSFGTSEPELAAIPKGVALQGKHHLLYYVVVQIDDVHKKVVIFNSLDKLIFIYNNLHNLVKSRMSKFSKFLEVRNDHNLDIEYLNTFTEYTDKSDTYFSEITNYIVKARDIYDFNLGRFVLSRGDKLHVTRMDLSSHEYHYEDTL